MLFPDDLLNPLNNISGTSTRDDTPHSEEKSRAVTSSNPTPDYDIWLDTDISIFSLQESKHDNSENAEHKHEHAIQVVENDAHAIDMPETIEAVKVIRITRKSMRIINRSSFILALIVAMSDATSIILSLKDMQEMSDDTLTKKLGFSVNHMYYIAPTFYAIPSFYIYYPSIAEGMKMAVSYRYSEIPLKFQSACCGLDLFSCCGKIQTRAVIATILFLVCFAAAADGLDGNYFMLSIATDPSYLWFIFSAIYSIPVAIATILTETPELFLFFCSNLMLALLPVIAEGEEYTPQPELEEDLDILSPNMQKLNKFIGNYLRFGGGVELAIEVYVALAALFNPTSLEGKYLLFTISFLRSSTNFFFYGKKGMEAIDAFFITMAQGPSIRQVLFFLMSLLPATFVMDGLRELYRKFLTDPNTDMPIDFPNFIVEYIAIHTAISEGAVLIGASVAMLMDGSDYVMARVCGPCLPEKKAASTLTIEVLDEKKEMHVPPPKQVIEMGSGSKEKQLPPAHHHNEIKSLQNDRMTQISQEILPSRTKNYSAINSAKKENSSLKESLLKYSLIQSPYSPGEGFRYQPPSSETTPERDEKKSKDTKRLFGSNPYQLLPPPLNQPLDGLHQVVNNIRLD